MTPTARRRVLLPIALLAACATQRLHQQGVVAFEHGAYEEAVAALEQAAAADPSNLQLRYELRTARETAVQRLVAAGDAARARGDADGATASYRRVRALDPGNDRALRGLEAVQADRRHAERTAKAEQLLGARKLDAAELEVQAVLDEDPAFAAARALRSQLDLARGPTSAVPRLRTRDDRPVTLQFRDAPTKMVFEALARQTGLNFVFDREVKSEGKTTVYVNQVPVEQAIDLILAQNQLGRQVLSDNIVLVYPNTPAKQKDYRDEIVHTFYLTNAAPKDAESMLKTVLASKTLFVDERSSTLVIRDTPEHVRMAEKLVASLDVPEPEVILEVEVVEIAHSLAEQLGINYPKSVAFSPTKPLGGAGLQGLVVSDLGKQGKNTITVSNLGVSVDLSKSVGASGLLASPRIRARNREKAKIVVGNRLPVVTSGTSATTGGTFATSNVQYVDAGLTLEVQPTIHNDGNVAVKLALEVSSIVKEIEVDVGNGGKNLVYEIGTRNTSTLLELRDGETQVLAGLIQDVDRQDSSHVPVLGDIPLLGRLFGSKATSKDKNEIVLSITPRIVRTQPRPSSETTEFWYGSEAQTRSGPFASAAATPAPAASGAAPVGPGGVSFGAGPAFSAPAPPPVSPRAPPERIESSARPPPPPPPPADTGAAAPDAAAAPPAPDARPQVTIEGPDSARIGDEIGVSVRLSSTSRLGRVRAQVGFDASALQLVSAEPGDLASESGMPKVETKAGGVQLDLAATEGAPVSGSGTLIDLRFRAVAARPAASVSTQVVLVGDDGVAVAATQATPLRIAVTK